MKKIIFIALVQTALFGLTVHSEEPVFDGINYESPKEYLIIVDSLGDQDAIKKQANELRGATDTNTLKNVLSWMRQNLSYDGNRAYEWRNYDTAVSEKCCASCADQAIVCGVLLKAAGIPTLWVKSMDVSWIWDFKNQRSPKSWSGHVYLESFIEGKWVLLDPGAGRIYVDYSTNARILPGNRFAYHKGNDPKKMIMSLQWEQWKQQTVSYFNSLDEGMLPVDTKSYEDLRPKCFIIANSPYYQLFGKLVQQNGGIPGPSFNFDYAKNLPRAKGNMILVQTEDGIPIVDVPILQKFFPEVPEGKQGKKLSIGNTTLVFVDVADLENSISSAFQMK